MKQTTGNDSGGSPVTLEPVVIIGRPLLPRLLSISGEYYYHNVGFWRDAMAYARSAKKPDAEFAIFMKRVNYQRGEWAKGIFGIIGGAVAAGVVVGLGTAPGAFLFFKTTTLYRMGINAVVQGVTNDKGFRDINVVSVVAEGLSPALGAFTNGFEFRPFSNELDRKLRIVGYNKTWSETIFDASVHFGTGRASGGLSNAVKKQVGEEASQKAVKAGMTHILFPIVQSGYQFLLQGTTSRIKDMTGITQEDGHEEVEQ